MSEQPLSRKPESPTKTLVIEFELPTFYAEDLGEQLHEWMREFGMDPDDPEMLGEEILHNIGDVHLGLLTVEVSGEKDSEIVRVPVIARGARVEDRKPTPERSYKESTDRLAERVDERIAEHGEWGDG